MERKLIIQLSDVTDPQIEIAKNKYNLPLAVMYHTDDGIAQAILHAEQIWDAIGCSFPDGCGNRRDYVTDVAVNLNAGNLPTYVSLIERGGAVLNHSAFHTGVDPLEQLEIIYDYYLSQINYKSAGVVPPGSEDYGQACIDHREPFLTSANDDTFGVLEPDKIYLLMPDEPDDSKPLPIVRQFSDWDNDGTITLFKGYIDQPRSEVNCLPFGSHSPLTESANVDRFIDFFEYLFNNYGEETIVCSIREYVDYILMRKIAMSTEIAGNIMTVTLEDSSIRLIDKISWFDNCFNLTGATITGVTHEGFDSVQFNPSTGLINANKRIIDWSPAPIRVNLTYTLS